jgi:ribosomal protein S18 acetylase RimI-like enzyme
VNHTSEPVEPTADIRLAIPDDAAKLAEFAERVFRRTFGPDNTASDLEQYVASAFGERCSVESSRIPNASVCWRMSGNAQRLPRCCVGATDAAVIGPSPVEIERFYVAYDFHGHGLAAHLMAACIETAVARGGRTMWLGVWEKNARAIRFYEKRGFADVGSHPFVLGTDVQTDRVMQRAIGPASA